MQTRGGAPGRRSDPGRADAAARRLALIAADLGVGPGAGAVDDTAEVELRPAASSAEQAWLDDHTRVRARVQELQDDPAPIVPGVAPELPEPGRHAARRRRPLPDPVTHLRDRLPPIGMAHVAVVAVVVAIGLGVAAWWVARDQATVVTNVSAQPAPPLLSVGAAQDVEPGASGAPTSGASAGPVTVDVAGKVRRPGIKVLDAGARVADAIKAAGGPRPGVDLTPLNLARVLVDGEQVLVGVSGAAAGAAAPAQPGASGVAGALVNLNTATAEQLEALPQVGPVTAQSIIAWRDQHGGFTSIDELLEVDGIGDKTMAQIAPHVTV